MLFEAVSSVFHAVIRIVIWRILRTDLEREFFIVLKENQILKRKRPGVRLSPWDRHFYLGLLRVPKRLLSRIVLVRPEIILGWHRKFVRRKWDHGRQGRVGRPRVTSEIQRLVIEMKEANSRWGAQRIMGELKKLGLKTCKASEPPRKLRRLSGLSQATALCAA